MKQPHIKIYDHGKPLFSLPLEVLLSTYFSVHGIEFPDGEYQLVINDGNLGSAYILKKDTK